MNEIIVEKCDSIRVGRCYKTGEEAAGRNSDFQ